MTPNDPPEPVLTRRALRRPGPDKAAAASAARTNASSASDSRLSDAAPIGAAPTDAPPTVAAADVATSTDATSTDAAPAVAAPSEPRPTTRALNWVREDGSIAVPQPVPAGSVALVERWPRRSPFRAGVLIPVGSVLALVAVYVVAMLVWPLYAVAPQVQTANPETLAAAPAAVAWPADGSAALGVDGLGTTASATDAVPMASLTKVITALVVLDSLPLAVGETGPEYAFTRADRTAYRNTLAENESALDVPVGGTLTQYQLLEGMLIGSAGNYADRLVDGLYPSDAVYSRAAMRWLSAHGLDGITVVDSSGISPRNTATPAALIALARRALANPVIAEIVAKPSVDLPGAGLVQNTNALLGEPGVVGIKTGLLNGAYNLLAARDITVGDTTVRTYGVILSQPDSATRFDRARELLTGLDAQLAPSVALPAGTVVGSVSTLWSDPVDIVTSADGSLILWNGSTSSAATNLALGDERADGASVGSVTLKGPLNSAVVDAQLGADVPDPSPWWRLTHPLELMGLVSGSSVG